MAKITKVPDGPLIKKKGPFKGNTLKNGGNTNSLNNNNMATINPPKKGVPTKKVPTKKVDKSLEGPQDAFKYSKGMPSVAPTLGSGAKNGKSMKKAKCGTKMKKK